MQSCQQTDGHRTYGHTDEDDFMSRFVLRIALDRQLLFIIVCILSMSTAAGGGETVKTTASPPSDDDAGDVVYDDAVMSGIE